MTNTNAKFFVYKHITPKNKYYIGITCQKLKERWRDGKGYKGQYFYKAIKKYGWENIEHRIVAHGLTKEQAKRLETKLIKYYKSNNKDFGYNLTEGGEYYSLNEESRKKISEKMMGNKNPMYNIHPSKHPNATKVVRLEDGLIFNSIKEANIYLGVKSSHITDCCSRYRTMSNKYHWMYYEDYIKSSKEDINKILNRTTSQFEGKEVICLDNFKIYKSAYEIEKLTGINHRNISRVCLYQRKHYKNTHWMFLKDFFKIFILLLAINLDIDFIYFN